MFDENFKRKEQKFVFKNTPIDYKPIQGFESEITRPSLTFKQGKTRNQLIASYFDVQDIPLFELGKKTLTQLLEIKENDPNDASWLKEKARLTAKLRADGLTAQQIEDYLKNNPPLGRQQYTRNVKKPISNANLGLDNKLRELLQEVKSGNTTTQAIANMTVSLSGVLQNLSSDLEVQQLKFIRDILQVLPTNLSPDDLNIEFQYLDNIYFKANQGKIILYLLRYALRHPPLTLDRPVYSNNTPIKISSLISAMSRNAILIINDPFQNKMKNLIVGKDNTKQIVKFMNVANPALKREDIQKLFSYDISTELDAEGL